MKRRTSVINNVILFAIVIGLVFAVAFYGNAKYKNPDLAVVIACYLGGAILWGLINAFCHETGHIIACKKNSFKVTVLSVWFFRWTRIRKRFRFDFTMIGNEAGFTESIPVCGGNMEKRYKNIAAGGIIASLVLTVISVAMMFTAGHVPIAVYCIFSISLPVSAYYFLGNILPMINGGARNDGAIIFGINKKDKALTVACSVLEIQAALFEGKSPSEIDEKLYFDLPQLPEDDLYFLQLLNARYYYYLDKGDAANAKKTSDRLVSLEDYLPKELEYSAKADSLYNACTFDYNEERADELMYELEKYLNSENTATNLRIKLAYLLYVKKEKEYAEDFYNRGVKVASKCFIKGLGKTEIKLFDEMKKDF